VRGSVRADAFGWLAEVWGELPAETQDAILKAARNALEARGAIGDAEAEGGA